MDNYKVNQQRKQVKPKSSKGLSGVGGRRKLERKDALKIVYISTPMKVKTSAFEFREIVQKLTGRESDVVRIMESYGSGEKDTWMVANHNHNHNHNHDHDYEYGQGNMGRDDVSLVPDPENKSSPSRSEELIETLDGVWLRRQECLGPFDPYLLDDQFSHQQLDVLGSY